MKLICLGDSLTAGLKQNDTNHWVHIAEQETGDTYINKGICGDTTGGMLARFYRDVVEEHGKVVLIMGGMNDFISGDLPGHVKSNIMAMVHQAWFYQIKPIVGIPMFFDKDSLPKDWVAFTDFSYILEVYKRLRHWLHHFSQVFHTEIIDFETGFEQLAKRPRHEYFADGLHPNDKGSLLMADWLVRQNGYVVTKTTSMCQNDTFANV